MEALHNALYNMSGRHYQFIYDETDVDVPELFEMDEIELYELYESLCEIEDKERDADISDDIRYRLAYETVRIMAAALSGTPSDEYEEDLVMSKKYPVVTLCGSTKFKNEFMQAQKKLTLDGYIVINVGLFGHAGDSEVWDDMDEGTKTQTKLMLDDMHKEKIDMADEIYVINPDGYIGESTWSEICYARMTDKRIESLEPIDEYQIEDMVRKHISRAEELAGQQLDAVQHQGMYANLDNIVAIHYKGVDVLDPWIKEDCQNEEWSWEKHKSSNIGVAPFEYYGKMKAARFVEEILMRRG